MKEKANNIISTLLLIVAIFFTIQYIYLARYNQELKTDLSEINHIQYGLLNVNEWESRIVVIVSEKIDEFELTDENQEKLQDGLENVLHSIIDELEIMMEERTSGGFSRIKRWAANLAFDVEQLRDSVPELSLMILEEVNKPETKSRLKEFLISKVHEFAQETFNDDNMVMLTKLLSKYGYTEKHDCRQFLESEIEQKKAAIQVRVLIILVLVLIMFILGYLAENKKNKFQLLLLLLASTCLLLGGVTTPMIDLEAKIEVLMFKLLGKDMVFADQIIFFQSKSIMDVVVVLLQDGSVQMIFVGILIFTFSIIFPSLKLISTYLYGLNIPRIKNNIWIRFFVLKSGKWSMADVMVVAIFMAYIGFNGIVSNQLHNMAMHTKPVEILTTNGTSLLGGFYLFLFFCISSLFLSGFIIGPFAKSKST